MSRMSFFAKCCAFASILPVLLWAQFTVDQSGSAHPWTSLKTDTSAFTFAIVADRTDAATPGVFEKAVQAINNFHPSMVLGVGDLIQGYTSDTAQIKKEWAEIASMVAPLKSPFFFVPGNHDLATPEEEADWERRFGSRYYSFMFRNALFLCMDSEDSGDGRFSVKQISWARKVLVDNPKPTWTFIFFHKPHARSDSLFASTIYPLISKRPCTMFNGHNHQYREDIDPISGNRWISLGTTGGGSPLRGWSTGSVDHITLVTVADRQPHIANIAVDAIMGPDVVTGPMLEFMDSLYTKVKVSVDLPSMGTGMKSSLRVRNVSKRPVLFAAGFQPGTAAVGALEVKPRLLKTGDSIVVPISVAIPAGRLTGIPDPAVIAWQAKGSWNGRDTATLHGTFGFWPDSARTIERVKKPVVIDGSLGEWDTAMLHPAQPELILGNRSDWTGSKDCGFAFGVAYDDSFLYVGISVTDDAVVSKPGHLAWEQDGIELRLDARPARVQANNSGFVGEMTEFLLLAVCPASSATDTSVQPFNKEAWPVGTKAVCVKNGSGYSAEMAVPVAYLNKMQGSPWQQVRLNLAIDDKDKANDRAQLWWKPDWRDGHSYVGSGTLMRDSVKR